MHGFGPFLLPCCKTTVRLVVKTLPHVKLVWCFRPSRALASKRLRREWYLHNCEELQRQHAEVHTKSAAVPDANTKLVQATHRVTQLARQQADAERTRAGLVLKADAASKDRQMTKAASDVAAERVRVATERQASLTRLKDRCPVCSQPIDRTHLANERTAAAQALAASRVSHAVSRIVVYRLGSAHHAEWGVTEQVPGGRTGSNSFFFFHQGGSSSLPTSGR